MAEAVADAREEVRVQVEREREGERVKVLVGEREKSVEVLEREKVVAEHLRTERVR